MMLMRLLQAIESATGIKPVPQVITGTRGIAYDWEVSSDNGSMTTANLSVRVISTANDEVLTLSNQIKKALSLVLAIICALTCTAAYCTSVFGFCETVAF